MQFTVETNELFGYAAAALVLGTFMMRTMILLRIVAIISNVAFMTYGFVNGLLPVLLLHLVLLPVNLYRLTEMVRLIAQAKDADPAKAIQSLTPYMKSLHVRSGETLFRIGDEADALFVLIRGRIRLDEFAIEVGPGDVIGEMGVFSTHGKRTATATCMEDCHLHAMAKAKVRELAAQNPQFGFYLIGTIADRLVEDLEKVRRSSRGGEGLLAQA